MLPSHFLLPSPTQVNENKDHEFYRQWLNIVNIGGNKKAESKAVGMQGKLQVSVCVLSESDIKVGGVERGSCSSLWALCCCLVLSRPISQQNPKLPIHVYDLEVQMWSELDHKKAVEDFNYDSNFLQNKVRWLTESRHHQSRSVATLVVPVAASRHRAG